MNNTQILGSRDAGSRLGVSSQYVRQLVAEGKISGARTLSGWWVFTVDEIDRFARERKERKLKGRREEDKVSVEKEVDRVSAAKVGVQIVHIQYDGVGEWAEFIFDNGFSFRLSAKVVLQVCRFVDDLERGASGGE